MKHDVWIPFKPNQVKSAYGNAGGFSTEDDRITFAARGQVDRYQMLQITEINLRRELKRLQLVN